MIQNIQPKNLEIFKSLFKWREDIYALRREKNWKSWYSPAYNFDWNEFVKHKEKWWTIKDFENKTLIPFNDSAIKTHLLWNKVIGIYPLLQDNTSYFLVADFDDKNWLNDSLKFIGICESYNILAYIERSRSWNGWHVWIFFEWKYPAFKSRQIFFEILKWVLNISEFQKEISFDRFFPNQDFLSKEWFWNLIALPLNWESLKNNNSCFLDTDTLLPFEDQWSFLENIKKVSIEELNNLHNKFIKNNDTDEKNITKQTKSKSLKIIVNNFIVLEKQSLSSNIIKFIKDELNFINPEFFLKKKLWKSTYKTEKFFNLIKEDNEKIYLPRGFLENFIIFLDENKIDYKIYTDNDNFENIEYKSNINLYKYQNNVLEITKNKNNWIIVSPPWSGKTVMALKIIEEKWLKSLIILHRKELLNQWKDRIESFYWINKKGIWRIWWWKTKIWEKVTLWMIQWLSRSKDLENLWKLFWTIIIDECHHIPAKTFRETISMFSPKFIYGFTATPNRKNNDEKLIYTYIWNILTEIDSSEIKTEIWWKDTSKNNIIIKNTNIFVPFNYKFDKYELISKILVYDTSRNKLIIDGIIFQLEQKKKILVLTERKEHVLILNLYLKNTFDIICLTWDDKERDSKQKIEQIKNLEFQVVIATWQFLWEWIDLDVFDTLFLIYPFSFEWKLIQYIWRVSRSNNIHTIYDYRDINIDYFEKLFKNRLRYYNKLVKKWDYEILN